MIVFALVLVLVLVLALMIVLVLVLGLALVIVLALGVDRHGVCWVQDGPWHHQVRVSVSVGVNDSVCVSVVLV